YREALLPFEEVVLDPCREAGDQINDWVRPQHQRMDLRRAPLMRMRVAESPASRTWYVHLQCHHIIGDHISQTRLVSEIVDHMQASGTLVQGSTPYRNHVARTLTSAVVNDSSDFFRDRLGDVDEPTAPFGMTNVHGDGSSVEECVRELDHS